MSRMLVFAALAATLFIGTVGNANAGGGKGDGKIHMPPVEVTVPKPRTVAAPITPGGANSDCKPVTTCDAQNRCSVALC